MPQGWAASAATEVRWQGLLLLLLTAVAVAGPAAAVEPNAAPGINRHYQGADPQQWRGVFERDGREVWDRRQDILRALALRPGMRVADVGAGTGFFSLLFAEAVGPEGHVYAVDITPEFVAAISARAAAAGIGNLSAVRNDPRSVALPEASVELVFISDTYHHFEYPRSTLESIFAALRPGGELVVIDFKRIPGVSSPWVMSHVRGGADLFAAEIEAAGFEFVEQLDFMQTQYFLRFRRP
jgi:ubiquinone/menaquinone biosynthesis C-methylase UbiE